jgi:hypothetical protein
VANNRRTYKRGPNESKTGGKAIPRNPREALAKERALAVLGFMRRSKVSLTAAAKTERIRPSTVRRYVGSAMKRSGLRGRTERKRTTD